MFCSVNSAGLRGLDGYLVQAECFADRGMFELTIIGLPDASVSEAQGRIQAVRANCGLPFKNGRTTISLAPADVKKSGSVHDLAMLVALLKFTLLEPCDLSRACFVGELSLDGHLRPCRGALSMALAAKEAGLGQLYLPPENAAEAAMVEGLSVYGVPDVPTLIGHLLGTHPLTPVSFDRSAVQANTHLSVDLAHVKGQETVKRAVEIAAAGGHNLLIIGHINLLSENEPRCA